MLPDLPQTPFSVRRVASLALLAAVLPTTAVGLEVVPGAEKTFGAAASQHIRFHMDFDKVEVLDVVKTVAQWTGKNFIVPDNLRGRITIIGPTDVTAAEAYATFVAALETNGLSLVPIGGVGDVPSFYKILPKRDSVRGTIPTQLDANDSLPLNEQMATRLFRLSHTDADPIKNVLQQFVSRDGEIIVYPPDVLIVSDDATNIRRIARFIDALDLSGSLDDVNVVQCNYAVAQELSAELLQIFQAQNGPAPGGAQHRPQLAGVFPFGHGPATETIQPIVTKIIPDERTNKLIIIAPTKTFRHIAELIHRLDVPTTTNQVHVYHLANADAEQTATILNTLSQGSTNRGTRGVAPPPIPLPMGATPDASSFTGQVKVTADKSTNSLLVMSSPADYASLVKVIEQLDVHRRQVFIEAVIMEVKLTNEDSHSVDFHGGYGFQNVTLPGTNSSTVPLIIGSEPTGGGTSLNVANLANLSGFLAGIQGPPITIPGLNISLPAFGVIINALQKDSDVDIISTPHILTSDNSEAEIEVGETVPFQTAVSTAGLLSSLSSSTTGATGGPGALGLGLGGLAPIQRQPVELRLKLKPHINESDYVRLEIDEQIEDIASTDHIRGPTTSKRAVKTTIVTKDQTTVVIGGLIQTRITRSESKFPILGSIPVLGYLFQNASTTKERTNLLLFLTPYIIRDQSDFRAIFERKMKERQEFVARFFGSSEEYATSIDYERKEGPLGLIHQVVRSEYDKLENGGPGTPQETPVYGAPPGRPPG